MDNVGEAEILKRGRYKVASGAVDRGVHNLQVVVALDNLVAEREGLDASQLLVVDILAYDCNQFGVGFELYFFDA